MMNEENNINIAFSALQNTMNSYLHLSDTTWNALQEICTFRYIKKNDCICRFNEYSEGFFFVSVGLFRTYILNEKGNEYNKIFFFENTFPGSMVALIKNETSNFEIQALEDSEIIHIDFKKI